MDGAEPDEAVVLRGYPPQWPGAPAPLIVANDARLALVYASGEGERAVAFLPRYEACRFARVSEPGFFEVMRSSWLDELEPPPSAGDAELRHLVFAFPGLRVEFATARWDLHMTRAAGADLVDELRALLYPEAAHVVPLVDRARGRDLPTTLYLPPGGPAPLVVFAHGWFGHPRKFTRLFRAWADAGIAVAAPAFPRTNDESPLRLDRDDVVNQPRDISFVIDELLRDESLRGRLDLERIGVGGYSLGAETALAVAFDDAHRDARIRAVGSLAGGFGPVFGGPWDIRETPLLVVHGRRDPGIPFAEARRVYDAAHGPKLFLAFDDEGHDVCQDRSGVLDDVVAATTAFWQLYLLGDELAGERLLATPARATLEAVGVARGDAVGLM